MAQSYLDWFNNTPLAVYTNANISGDLLDWVAEGVYGLKRPTITSGSVSTLGPLNTWQLDTLMLNESSVVGSINIFTTTDDIFKRILTWHFFKGDGKEFSVIWLKRRVLRFLIGMNGVAPNIDQTYQISVIFGTYPNVTILIDVSGAILPLNAQIFQAAVQSAAVELPFQYVWTITLSDTTSLANIGGQLQFTGVNAAPTTNSGVPGSIWNNGGVVSVVGGYTPGTPQAVFVGSITAAQLISLGAKVLPQTNPGVTGELYVDTTSLEVWVS